MNPYSIQVPFLPGDRVRLTEDHLLRVRNEWEWGDWGPDARGTVVEVRARQDGTVVLVVAWDGGSVRNLDPRALEVAP